jgi:MFS transporter, DHA1 family, multidrug resistance protein
MQSVASAPPRIGETARRRGIAALLLSTGLMYGGFFMLVPLISVHYTNNLHFAAAAVGLALALRQLTQQGLTLFGGALSDVVGPRRLIVAGALIRTVGFAGLAWANTLPLLLLMCLIAALGGALFDAPSNAAFAALSDPNERNRVFALSGIAGGLGMTLGPLLGGLLVRFDFGLVCFVSAACFGVVGVLAALLLPDVRPAPGSRPAFVASMGHIWHDRAFVALTALLGGYWFMWVQISTSLPLIAERLAQAPLPPTPGGALVGLLLAYTSPVALLYTINSLLTIGLQYGIARVASQWLAPFNALALGVACIGIGLLCVSLADNLVGLLWCVMLYSIGSLFVAPTSRTLTAQMARPTELGAYFGFGSLALAFGGSAGNFMGGWLTDLSLQFDLPLLPWLTFGSVGCAAALGFVLLGRAVQRHEAPSQAPQS